MTGGGDTAIAALTLLGSWALVKWSSHRAREKQRAEALYWKHRYDETKRDGESYADWLGRRDGSATSRYQQYRETRHGGESYAAWRQRVGYSDDTTHAAADDPDYDKFVTTRYLGESYDEWRERTGLTAED